jgi:hypothetical protein
MMEVALCELITTSATARALEPCSNSSSLSVWPMPRTARADRLSYITLSFRSRTTPSLPHQLLRSWAAFRAMQVLCPSPRGRKDAAWEDVCLEEGDSRAVLFAGVTDERRDTGIGDDVLRPARIEQERREIRKGLGQRSQAQV